LQLASRDVRRLKALATEYSAKTWSKGGLSWKTLAKDLWNHSSENDLTGRAAQLSFYFLVAVFPLLIFLSALVGYFLSSQTKTYLTLLHYLNGVMPHRAFTLFQDTFNQITHGASNGKLSVGLIIALWSASSGIAALIEGLNIAFAVPSPRSWWRRRLVAVALTLAIGILISAALVFLLIGHTAGALVVARVPVLSTLSALSSVFQWLVGVGLLLVSLMVIYRYGPNLQQKKRWEGVLPGCCLALLGWLLASFGFRYYLVHFGSLDHMYGSLAGVIALLFWLYLSAAAILLGGELNSIIWHAASGKDKG
jgi:membrane protein